MPAIVSSVVKGSIAEELEIQAGDEVVSIDDSKMLDMIDYNSESCKANALEYDKDIVALKGTLVLIKSDNRYFINSMMIR